MLFFAKEKLALPPSERSLSCNDLIMQLFQAESDHILLFITL